MSESTSGLVERIGAQLSVRDKRALSTRSGQANYSSAQFTRFKNLGLVTDWHEWTDLRDQVLSAARAQPLPSPTEETGS